MTIRFQCPKCPRQFVVYDAMGGRRATCPECLSAMTIPTVGPDSWGPSGAAICEAPRSSHATAMALGTMALVCLLGLGYKMSTGATPTDSTASANSSAADRSSPGTGAAQANPGRDNSGRDNSGQDNTGRGGSWFGRGVSRRNAAGTDAAGSGRGAGPDRQSSAGSATGSNSNHRLESQVDVESGVEDRSPTNPVQVAEAVRYRLRRYEPSPESPGVAIAFRQADEVTFGPVGCPFVRVGNDLYQIESGNKVCTLDGNVTGNSIRAFSRDGKYFAAGSKSHNQRDTTVRVWDTSDGGAVCEIPGDPERFVDLVEFTAGGQLLLGGRLSTDLRVFDVAENRELVSIQLPGRCERDKTTFSPDGKFYTAMVDRRLVVMQRGGKPVVELQARPLENMAGLSEIQIRIKTTQSFAAIDDVAFSPDGTEVAAATDEPRILCWDAAGKLVFNRRFPALDKAVGFSPQLRWLPDATGWVLNGHVIDRATGRVVFGVATASDRHPAYFPLDRSTLFGTLNDEPPVLRPIDVPWGDIDESLGRLQQAEGVAYGPSRPVRIEVNLAGVAGASESIRMAMADVLHERIEADGIPVEATADAQLQMGFLAEENGSLVVQLVRDQEILWRHVVDDLASGRIRAAFGELPRMRNSLHRELDGLPYFVPESTEFLPLPILVN